ncbi:MAG: MCE family protein [Gammaproteobacteria bacterium]|nr:MCE family protein [Gammaproteobacteria bacterium]
MASGREPGSLRCAMEREANYAAVGAFVLIVTLLGALFVYWYSDTREHRDYNRYEIYFAGSVSGLAPGGPVRYLGVGVGRVYDMRIDPRDSSRVQVIVDIDSRTPISANTVAQLNLQGITGLLYIDLLEDRSHQHLTPAVEGLKYPVIRSSPSRFDAFLAGLPELAAAAASLVQRAETLLSDENMAAVSTTLGNLRKASSGLPQTMRDLNALIAELRSAGAELAGAAGSARRELEASAPDVRASVARLHAIADNLADASGQLDQLIAENRADVRSFTRTGLPEIERFVREGRAAAEDIRALAGSLREDPAQLLYEPQPRGVAIPR